MAKHVKHLAKRVGERPLEGHARKQERHGIGVDRTEYARREHADGHADGREQREVRPDPSAECLPCLHVSPHSLFALSVDLIGERVISVGKRIGMSCLTESQAGRKANRWHRGPPGERMWL